MSAQRSLPAPRTPDPMAAPAVRWGVLAPGWIAEQFAGALRRGTRQEIVAVGSRSLERARAFADECGAPAAYGSYQELVDDPEVDIVYVASPHSEHHRQARLALEAGKPVLVEKAFTRNAAEARELVDLARSNGLFLMEAMWSRFLPHYDVIEQAVQGGLIGEVTTVFADHGQRLYPGGPQRLSSPELAGGALLDLGVYPIHLRRLRARPVRLDHRGRHAHRSRCGQPGVRDGHRRRRARSACCTPRCSPARPAPRRSAGPRAGWTSGAGSTSRPGCGCTTATARWSTGTTRSGDVEHQGLRFQAAEVARCLTAGAHRVPRLPLDTTLRVMSAMDTVRAQLGVRFPGE